MRTPVAGLLAALLLGALTACNIHDPQSRPRTPPVADTPEPPPRPHMPLTESAFLQPADQPVEHALGHSYLLLPWRARDDAALNRQQAACLGLRLALQQAERQHSPLSSQLMPIWWPLEKQASLQDCGQLVKHHDYQRARALLGRPLSDLPGPLLVARALESNELLVLDLARFSDSDLRKITRFWVHELGSEPQFWSMQGFAMARIQQALAPYVKQYGKTILQVRKDG